MHFFTEDVNNTEKLPTVSHGTIPLHVLLSSLMYAAGASIFYKKSFNESMLSFVGSLLCLGFTVDQLTRSHPIGGAVYLMVVTNWMVARNRELLSASLRNITLLAIFFFALVDVRCDIVEHWFPYWPRLLLTALPQLVRSPVWLKAHLQGLRSRLGPLYLLYVSRLAIGVITARSDAVLPKLLALVSMISANLAGCMYRPDNKTVLEHFHHDLTRVSRRYYHGRLMSLSFATATMLIICLWGNFNGIPARVGLSLTDVGRPC